MKLYAAPLNFDGVAAEFGLDRGFPAAVEAEARAAGDAFASQRDDARDLPLVTLDPPGSKDLDQATALVRRDGGGYRVYYAIADVAAFVVPGGAVEAESLRRGQTVYLPDEPARLHPAVLSEDRASLLPNVDRPAVLWTIDLDPAGEVAEFSVRRALVHSVARLDYEGVHADYLAGRLHPSLAALPEVGRLRAASALRREAVNLRLPAQRVEQLADGRVELAVEPRLEVMDFNSELSLLTGMCAGELMARHRAGLLRTLHPAAPEAEREFFAEAAVLGYPRQGRSVGELLAAVDATTAKGMAVMREATKLLRGADLIDLAAAPPEVHAGIGGYYAHVTAPLRRLSDRFATECCLALSAGAPIPEWAASRLGEVAAAMKRTSQLAGAVDRACLGLTEATVLRPWVGQNFDAVVLSSDAGRNRARIFVLDPPVLAEAIGAPKSGTDAVVSLVAADPERREVAFAWPAD